MAVPHPALLRRSSHSVVPAALVGFALGCVTTVPAGADDAAPPGGYGEQSSADNAAKPDEATLHVDEAREEATRILAEVARARNLEVIKPVEIDVIDREGIRKFAKDSMYEHMTMEELRRLGRIESSLGVIPVGADPEAILLDLLEDNVLGLYDPKTKTLFIGDFVPKLMLSQVVGHEIAHGLQDMHFNLRDLQKPIDHRGDEESARRFLFEGGAQAAYLSWVAGQKGLSQIGDAVLDAMGNQVLEYSGAVTEYPILARSLQLPYADGTATVIRLVLAKGWGAVDALYKDLPESTEQMLHIDKLLRRERPRPVKVDSHPLEEALGLELIWHDQLGEAALLSMLAEVNGAKAARRAAAGWGGDHVVILDDKTKPLRTPVVVAAVAWDSEGDAKEFAKGFGKYLDEHVKEGTWLDRRRETVVFATGLPDGTDRTALSKAAWTAVVVGPAPGKKGKKR